MSGTMLNGYCSATKCPDLRQRIQFKDHAVKKQVWSNHGYLRIHSPSPKRSLTSMLALDVSTDLVGLGVRQNPDIMRSRPISLLPNRPPTITYGNAPSPAITRPPCCQRQNT